MCRLTSVDSFGKGHTWNCECVNTIIRKEYFIQSRSAGLIKELSLIDKKIKCFVDFREKEYDHEPYISGEYLNPETIIKTKEDLKRSMLLLIKQILIQIQRIRDIIAYVDFYLRIRNWQMKLLII